MNMTSQKSWEEFRHSGMLWWVNMILHTFGWAIVTEVDQDGNVVNAYPSRVKFRGFNEKSNTEGYIKVSNYLAENADTLLEESKS
jgi:hypothetical protein